MISLVGSTGFVGGNIAAGGPVDGLFHSTNIEEAFGTRPDVLIYAGLRAEKFLAAKFPEQDLAGIQEAQENIRKIDPKQLVLISTVDVYETARDVTEDDPAKGQGAYGKNRALLERWVTEDFSRKPGKEALIVRLPGLFGPGIKKNFIYDYIHYIPALLNESRFVELSAKAPELNGFYALNEKGFYQCRALSGGEEDELRDLFKKLGFSALNFTDSRGVFQYYYLGHLYDDIFRALDHNIRTLNISTEPVSISGIYHYLTGTEFQNEISEAPPLYDMRTLHFETFGGFAASDRRGGYMYSRQDVLEEIKTFTEERPL